MSGQYWDQAFNTVSGCSPASPGCTNCWAREMHERFGKGDFSQVRTLPERLAAPLHWRKDRVIFTCNTSDLFHTDVPNEFIAATFGVMAACPQHEFLVLTKRIGRAMDWFDWVAQTADREQTGADHLCQQLAWQHHVKLPLHKIKGTFKQYPWPLPNVWLGVTIEDQARCDERLPLLQATPAAHSWVSFEPLLGPVEVRTWTGIDWAVIGCESGPERRHGSFDAILSLAASAHAAGVAVWIKQIDDKGRVIGTPAPGSEWARVYRRNAPRELMERNGQ